MQISQNSQRKLQSSVKVTPAENIKPGQCRKDEKTYKCKSPEKYFGKIFEIIPHRENQSNFKRCYQNYDHIYKGKKAFFFIIATFLT